MNDNVIEIKNLTRGYDGQEVLKNLDLTVRRGSVYGFLGRNGSGKTTTIKILAGLLRPSSGTARVLGGDPWTFGAPERWNLGYLSEKQTLPPLARVRKLIDFCARLYPEWDRPLCESLVSRFQISPGQRVHKLSLGNQRLLAFILAIAPRPDVLLLDEPAANLDVVARREFLDEILALIRDGGKTVLFSTHILSDVERVADEIGILAHGSLKAAAPLDDLKEGIKEIRFFDFTGPPPIEVPGALHFKRTDREIVAVLPVDRDGPRQIAARWHCRFEIHDLSLEDIFIQITRHH